MKVFLFILLTSISAIAQTSSSLRQKYNEPISETFKIRPQVLLTVKYAKTGEVCSMLIKPQSFIWLSDTKTLEDKVLDDVLEELAPQNQRGKFLVGTHRNGLLSSYERVEILRNGETDKWCYGAIYWKNKACGN